MNSSFGENLPSFSSESEQGAHAALTELEKGLRSTKLGEQAEAIVRFPHLFSQYPFPILINSGMMKLADLFKQGSNFLKMCVLRVFQQSSLHLDKVTSVDEFLKRIITVNNSNDPVARALTLRVLGAIAQIIAERKNVHHKVRCQIQLMLSEVSLSMFICPPCVSQQSRYVNKPKSNMRHIYTDQRSHQLFLPATQH